MGNPEADLAVLNTPLVPRALAAQTNAQYAMLQMQQATQQQLGGMPRPNGMPWMIGMSMPPAVAHVATALPRPPPGPGGPNIALPPTLLAAGQQHAAARQWQGEEQQKEASGTQQQLGGMPRSHGMPWMMGMPMPPAVA